MVSQESDSIELEDFNDFYRKFNEDSVFQKTRIQIEKGWNPDWHIDIFHVDSGTFIITSKNSDGGIRERITNKVDTTHFVEYLLKPKKGKWFLVEYVDSYND